MFDENIETNKLQEFLLRLENKYGRNQYPLVEIFSDGSGHFTYGIGDAEQDLFFFDNISELNEVLNNPETYIGCN